MNGLKPIVIIGAGGHASVVADLIRAKGWLIKGFVASSNTPIKGFSDIPYLGDDTILLAQAFCQEINVVNGIGSISPEGNKKRFELYRDYKKSGYEFLTLIHSSAVVSNTAQIGEGVQIMAGAVIQANAVILDNTIINTRASIDHDCIIGNSCHIAPGATLSGNIKVGDYSHIGVGATVIQGVTIERDMMIRAGGVVLKDRLSMDKIV